MLLTNGTYIGEDGPIRKFQEIYSHGEYVWVIALNGNYAGEYLTFKAAYLRPLTGIENENA